MAKSAAIFPGSFDPFTNGHVDILERSLKIFDRVIVGVLNNPNKSSLFTVEERVALIQTVVKPYRKRVAVHTFSGLLVDFAHRMHSKAIVRGLRAISDYDYETQMALMNRHLDSSLETLFLVTSEENSYVSSSLVKQIGTLGGDITGLVPVPVAKALARKLATLRKGR